MDWLFSELGKGKKNEIDFAFAVHCSHLYVREIHEYSPFDFVHCGGKLQDSLLSGHLHHTLCTELQLCKIKFERQTILLLTIFLH